jgi:hypothetical protein
MLMWMDEVDQCHSSRQNRFVIHLPYLLLGPVTVLVVIFSRLLHLQLTLEGIFIMLP